MKDYARKFYASTRWVKTQAAYMASKHFICERCGGAARIVHHKQYITPDNIHDVDITLSWDNLEAVCMDCHLAEHEPHKSRKGGPHVNRKGCAGIANGLRFDESGNIEKIDPASPPPYAF